MCLGRERRSCSSCSRRAGKAGRRTARENARLLLTVISTRAANCPDSNLKSNKLSHCPFSTERAPTNRRRALDNAPFFVTVARSNCSHARRAETASALGAHSRRTAVRSSLTRAHRRPLPIRIGCVPAPANSGRRSGSRGRWAREAVWRGARRRRRRIRRAATAALEQHLRRAARRVASKRPRAASRRTGPAGARLRRAARPRERLVRAAWG